jgi:hypothetical protein
VVTDPSERSEEVDLGERSPVRELHEPQAVTSRVVEPNGGEFHATPHVVPGWQAAVEMAGAGMVG